MRTDTSSEPPSPHAQAAAAAGVVTAAGADAARRLARREDLIRQFRELLPQSAVLHEEEDLRPYECDGLTAYRQPAHWSRCCPKPTEPEVQRHPTRICKAEHGIPVVARGAGTGLSGGALPLARRRVALARDASISILQRRPRGNNIAPWFSRACAISPSPRRSHSLGLYYAPDPSSQIACSIGGNVAENAGGLHCLKYGLTVHNILATAGGHHRRRADRPSVSRGLDAAWLRSARTDDRLRGPARRRSSRSP